MKSMANNMAKKNSIKTTLDKTVWKLIFFQIHLAYRIIPQKMRMFKEIRKVNSIPPMYLSIAIEEIWKINTIAIMMINTRCSWYRQYT